MANSAIDDNRDHSLLGVSSVTFTGTETAAVNPTTHALLVEATASTSDQDVVVVPTASPNASLSFSRTTSLSNTATAVKASAGSIYKVHLVNPNTSNSYVQLYNVAAGSVVVGTTTPDWTWFVPAGGAFDDTLIVPMYGSTALTVAATTTASP